MLDYDIAKHNLPNEHNLREDLCRNLAVQCGSWGYLTQARFFQLEEIRAREANLRAAVLWETEWHRRHFSGFRRFRAGFDLMGSWTNGFLWGHGEKIRTLLRNTIILSIAIFPA